MSNLPRVLVTDFDGTITRNDFYQLVVQRFLTPGDLSPWNDYRSGRISHFQALQRIFRNIRRPTSEVLDLLRDMRIDPRLPESVETLRRCGWDVVVASAGCEWYIKRMLAELDVNVIVHSNPGEYPEGGPLEMYEPKDSPFYCPETGIDKAGIVRHYLEEGRTVAYAGDGYTDVDAALLVPDSLRFARADLAESLEKRDEDFRPFTVWSEIAGVLIAGEPKFIRKAEKC